MIFLKSIVRKKSMIRVPMESMQSLAPVIHAQTVEKS